VLKQRADREVAAEQALALARKEYNKCLSLLENTRLRLKELEVIEINKLNFFDVRQLTYYRGFLSERIKAQENDVNNAALVVEQKLGGVVKARQERQAIEKLKEHYLQRCKREMADRERKEVDELSLNVYQRRIKHS
jgi:flagellar export protein FliJ